ncbi:CLOCK-interacting pacemaker isoform X2 [Centropristis striata]|uniref:CLOCK-interacting pacemaker isoform X2 n=1 Tax=Centropristis striata TaxID=184440 RepID=UPI0027E12224|nr:CLOCK-interacting pacemaker isoform X2 [Centropristis striata]
MPKEQPFLSEHSLSATPSKNAKNKSNSMTLLAMRDTKDADNSSGRGSRCSSEKDSGYSDVSDWQQTDVEDQQSNKSQTRGSERAETAQPGQTKDPDQGNPGNPNLMPAGHALPPIYIINNLVIKQVRQPSLLPVTLQLHKSSSRKSNATEKKNNGTYLPILNSYPRIAPHPSKKPPDKSLSNDESQNLSKRVCTERKNDNIHVTKHLPEKQLYKQPKIAVVASGLPCPSSPGDSQSSSSLTNVSSSQGSASGSTLYTASSIFPTRELDRNGTNSARQRRFLNTVEILKQSGLLDITLRAKELLRQSNATEQNIAQLRQHTELLCQAASNPSCSLGGITAWDHLYRAMAESGNYPNLKVLRNVQIPCPPGSANQPVSISTSGADWPQAAESSEVPPSRLVTTIPDPTSEQSRDLEARVESSEKVTFMSPDSSTG